MKVENVVIVGGGTAGWMTATTLISCFPNIKVTLVENPNIETVGVGESTIGSVNNWLYLNDIKDADFMPHCDATYKLSIGFENWLHKDTPRFHYPFNWAQEQSFEDIIKNDYVWELKKAMSPETPMNDYADCVSSVMSLVNANTLTEKQEMPHYSLQHVSAYHFDATKLGLWLRDYKCIPKGLTHIKENVLDARVNENGIEYLTLSNEKRLTADLFIDCSGFKSLLINEMMGIPFESLSDIIPNNYAWATKIPYKDKNKQIVNYTNCTAIGNGWVWEIPLQSRMGSGYVYSDRFISHDKALLEFQQTLTKKGYENVEQLEYKHIPMKIGYHEKLWVKNVCAIGLSGAFCEPLESNGIFTVHHFLAYLVWILDRDGHVTEWDRKYFNSKCLSAFIDFTNFIRHHYAYSHRDDTEYWREITERDSYQIGPEISLDGDDDGPRIKGIGGRYIRKGFGLCDITFFGFKRGEPNITKANILARENEVTGVTVGEEIKSLNRNRDKYAKLAKNYPSPYEFLKLKGLASE